MKAEFIVWIIIIAVNTFLNPNLSSIKAHKKRANPLQALAKAPASVKIPSEIKSIAIILKTDVVNTPINTPLNNIIDMCQNLTFFSASPNSIFNLF